MLGFILWPLTFLSFVWFIVAFFFLDTAAMRRSNDAGVRFFASTGKALATFLISLLTLLAYQTAVQVPTGYAALVRTWGKVEPVALEPGLHFIIPIAQDAELWETTTLKSEDEKAASSSKDLQQVTTSWVINWHIPSSALPRIAQLYGLSDFGGRILEAAATDAIKAATSNFTAEELITRRELVRTTIIAGLKAKLSPYGIVIDDFNTRNFSFSQAFTQAIEAKTTAEQLKLKAENDLARIKVENEQKISQAEAEARSLQLQKAEVTDNLIKLRQIEMQSKAIEKWDGVLPTTTGGAMPFIDVGK